jgi:cytochrome c peroxidase
MFAIAMVGGSKLRNPMITVDSTGALSTYSAAGGVDLSSAFFQSLGSNGRSCSSCHVLRDAWSVAPADLQARFDSSLGRDPVFRPVDGANCPTDDVSTYQSRRAAYSLLLSKGVFRISLPVPSNAEFSITQIQDPYACAQTTPTQPAMYRRPLPATNLNFLSAVMWDGRETVAGAVPGKSINLSQSLANQATDATLGHAQATGAPTAQQLADIVAFETALFTAQIYDENAGSLVALGALGGPFNLAQQPFYIGINDPLGGDPTGAVFNQNAFTIYNKWASLRNQPDRQAVARGQALFNNFPIEIKGVNGLNDALGVETIQGTCTTCHDSPNVGNHSVALALNIGTTGYPVPPALDISGLPVYTIQCTNGTTIQVTDPGRALVTGKCADLGKVKGPVLRGLAGRPPYFHNGSAATLRDVVDFYDQRFSLNLTEQQKSDLVAFLQTL